MNLHSTLILIFGFTFGVANAQQLAPNAPNDQPFQATAAAVSEIDKALVRYIEKAKNTYPDARKRFLAGLPENYHFLVTTRIKDPDGKFEQVFIYVTLIDQANKIVTGRISNPLDVVKTYKRGQTIRVPEDAVIDWTIARPDGTEEGNIIGKFLEEYMKKKG